MKESSTAVVRQDSKFSYEHQEKGPWEKEIQMRRNSIGRIVDPNKLLTKDKSSQKTSSSPDDVLIESAHGAADIEGLCG